MKSFGGRVPRRGPRRASSPADCASTRVTLSVTSSSINTTTASSSLASTATVSESRCFAGGNPSLVSAPFSCTLAGSLVEIGTWQRDILHPDGHGRHRRRRVTPTLRSWTRREGRSGPLPGRRSGLFTGSRDPSWDSGASDIALWDGPARPRGDQQPGTTCTPVCRTWAALPFGPAIPYQTSDVWYSTAQNAEPETSIISYVKITDVPSASFTAAGVLGIVAMNRGYYSLGLLAGLDGQGLANAHRVLLDFQPTAMVTGDFNRDGLPDVGVLGYAKLAVFLADGHGGLTLSGKPPSRRRGGADRDGHRRRRPARPARRQPLRRRPARCWATATAPSGPTARPTRPCALAVADLTGDGKPDFIYANQGLDRVGRPVRQRPDQGARRPVLRPALPRRGQAGRPQRRRHPRPDRRQQRQQQRAGLSRRWATASSARRPTAGTASSPAPTPPASRSPTSTASPTCSSPTPAPTTCRSCWARAPARAGR